MRKFLIAGLVMTAFSTLALADTARVDEHYGSWVAFVATDPMTDKTWYGAVANSTAGGNIQVDCVQPDKLNVMFRAKAFLGDGLRDATYRVDSNAAHKVTASYSDYTVSLLCDGAGKGDGRSKPEVRLVTEMKKGTTLLLRLTTFRNEELDLSFQIDGAQEAFEHVLSGCLRLAATKKTRS